MKINPIQIENIKQNPKTKQRTMIQLQPRDCALIDLIYEHQFITTFEAERYVYKSLNARRVRERILELERSGLLRREPSITFGHRNVLRLTKSGLTIADTRRPFIVRQRSKLDLSTLLHERSIIMTRLRLSELWDGRFIPEAALKQAEFPRIPDGVWIFPNGNQIALEIENSLKGPERFHQIQDRWKGIAVKAILYLATTPQIHANVKRYIETGSRNLPFVLTTIENLEREQPEPAFTIMGNINLFNSRCPL